MVTQLVRKRTRLNNDCSRSLISLLFMGIPYILYVYGRLFPLMTGCCCFWIAQGGSLRKHVACTPPHTHADGCVFPMKRHGIDTNYYYLSNYSLFHLICCFSSQRNKMYPKDSLTSILRHTCVEYKYGFFFLSWKQLCGAFDFAKSIRRRHVGHLS